MKKIGVVFIALFLLITVVPVCFFGNQDEESTENERRNLAQRVEFPASIENIDAEFTESINTYFSDHIGFRASLVEFANKIKFKILSSSAIPSSKRIIEGLDGWLFYDPQGYSGDPIGDYLGETTFSAEEINEKIEFLTSLKSVCDEVGTDLYLVICPNKEGIYGDLYLPEYYHSQRAETTRVDILVNAIQTRTNIKCVYPKEDIMNQREDILLYYKHDTHWNRLGAYIAYRQWKEMYDGMTLPNLSQCVLIKQDGESCDLADNLGISMEPDDYYYVDLQNDFTYDFEVVDEQNGVKKYTTTNNNGKSLLVFHDSYGGALIPYVVTNFETADTFSRKIKADDFGMIREMKPDVLIFEVVERHCEDIGK